MSDIPICECGAFWDQHHDECPVLREITRLRAEVANRNQRALDGDKAKAAFDNVFDENERLRAEVQHLRTGWITLQIDIGDLIPAIDGERANDPMINRVKRVVTELAEARKPTCNACANFHSCWSRSWNNPSWARVFCPDGERFDRVDPVRLYEKEGEF